MGATETPEKDPTPEIPKQELELLRWKRYLGTIIFDEEHRHFRSASVHLEKFLEIFRGHGTLEKVLKTFENDIRKVKDYSGEKELNELVKNVRSEFTTFLWDSKGVVAAGQKLQKAFQEKSKKSQGIDRHTDRAKFVMDAADREVDGGNDRFVHFRRDMEALLDEK